MVLTCLYLSLTTPGETHVSVTWIHSSAWPLRAFLLNRCCHWQLLDSRRGYLDSLHSSASCSDFQKPYSESTFYPCAFFEKHWLARGSWSESSQLYCSLLSLSQLTAFLFCPFFSICQRTVRFRLLQITCQDWWLPLDLNSSDNYYGAEFEPATKYYSYQPSY